MELKADWKPSLIANSLSSVIKICVSLICGFQYKSATKGRLSLPVEKWLFITSYIFIQNETAFGRRILYTLLCCHEGTMTNKAKHRQ